MTQEKSEGFSTNSDWSVQKGSGSSSAAWAELKAIKSARSVTFVGTYKDPPQDQFLIERVYLNHSKDTNLQQSIDVVLHIDLSTSATSISLPPNSMVQLMGYLKIRIQHNSLIITIQHLLRIRELRRVHNLRAQSPNNPDTRIERRDDVLVVSREEPRNAKTHTFERIGVKGESEVGEWSGLCEGEIVEWIWTSDDIEDLGSIGDGTGHGAYSILVYRYGDDCIKVDTLSEYAAHIVCVNLKTRSLTIPPAREVSPTVGLIPTKLFLLLGLTIEPSVSLPRAAVVSPMDVATPLPDEEPEGSQRGK